ncbi:hypothetical protein TSUD_337680 [Trifolium subterraneum]|uniref:Uncharacterized protein n=1 Tax=Trifolium subterraneum TaxID=3900 RepID=A0A2Z6LQ56_TRISU|nr:hypothetical protein TSUD_337680 [Trifolium subterraneum]
MPWDRARLKPKKRPRKFRRNSNRRFNIVMEYYFDEATVRVTYQTTTSRGAIDGIMRAIGIQFATSFKKRMSNNM